MVISEDNKLNVIKDLYVNWNKSFWYSVYIYLVIEGLIIVALTEVMKSTGNIMNENSILSLLVILGILFTVIWCLVLNRPGSGRSATAVRIWSGSHLSPCTSL